jgi:hypothetical protein
LHGGSEKCIHRWCQKIRKDLLGGLGIGGSIILKYKIKTRQDVRVCTQFIWFIVGSGVDFVSTAMNLKILQSAGNLLISWQPSASQGRVCWVELLSVVVCFVFYMS